MAAIPSKELPTLRWVLVRERSVQCLSDSDRQSELQALRSELLPSHCGNGQIKPKTGALANVFRL